MKILITLITAVFLLIPTTSMGIEVRRDAKKESVKKRSIQRPCKKDQTPSKNNCRVVKKIKRKK